MKTHKWPELVIVLLLTGIPASAQTVPKVEKSNPPSSTAAKPAKKGSSIDDLAAIRQTGQEFVKAFNDADAKAVAALWAKDGDYTDELGERYSGRESIEQAYAKFFAAQKGKRIRVVIDSLRMLSETAAIEDGRILPDSLPESAPGGAKYMAVHVKVDGQWLMSTVRDVRENSASTEREIDDLEWLIGTWVAEEYGATTESVCRWVANKSFVERSYVVKHPDGTTASGVQFIGYNPRTGNVQSWNFSSDGGFATGVWTRQAKGWSAAIEGTMGNGTLTTATNTLTRLDDNAYAWHSTSRTAGSVRLSDTDEVVMKRKPASR